MTRTSCCVARPITVALASFAAFVDEIACVVLSYIQLWVAHRLDEIATWNNARHSFYTRTLVAISRSVAVWRRTCEYTHYTSLQSDQNRRRRGVSSALYLGVQQILRTTL